MARSYIDPSLVAMAVEPAAPPWNWNPGATFVQAFNDAQENKRAQEKMALEQELAQILLPYKQQTAAFELEKLQQEVERSTLLTKKLREGGQVAHRGIMDGLQNPGQTNQKVSPWNTTVRVRKSSASPGVNPDMVDQVDAVTPLPIEDEDILVPPSP
jgi:hypothetical protein